jgi:hypothetical protein
MSALHSFWYDRAHASFEAALAVDPACAMAAGGDAMAHVHPVWRGRDLAKGRAALARVREAGLTPKELAFVDIARALFAVDDMKEANAGWLRGAAQTICGTTAPTRASPRFRFARGRARRCRCQSLGKIMLPRGSNQDVRCLGTRLDVPAATAYSLKVLSDNRATTKANTGRTRSGAPGIGAGTTPISLAPIRR